MTNLRHRAKNSETIGDSNYCSKGKLPVKSNFI